MCSLPDYFLHFDHFAYCFICIHLLSIQITPLNLIMQVYGISCSSFILDSDIQAVLLMNMIVVSWNPWVCSHRDGSDHVAVVPCFAFLHFGTSASPMIGN